MKPREFTYIGQPVPKIDQSEHREFLLNFQKAMLQSLTERKLLTSAQAEQALNELTMRSNRK